MFGQGKFSTFGTPTPQVSESTVKRTGAPTVFGYSWGGNKLRWELEPTGYDTRLTFWHNIDKGYIAWSAAG